jgi:hypothetical protein
MNHMTTIILMAGALAAGACGDSSEAPRPTPAPSARPAATDLISQATVDGCAGFTRERAAALLGVDPATVIESSETVGRVRQCTFRSPTIEPVTFTLSRRASVDAARRSMASERESMAMFERAVGGVTGKTSTAPATEDVSRIGDEAFYSVANGAVMLRVGNVIAQVTGPGDMALKKKVAEEVALRLRT